MFSGIVYRRTAALLKYENFLLKLVSVVMVMLENSRFLLVCNLSCDFLLV